ncbi:AzlD domain-containing protein [Motiliproteus coralliicola]|uniref:AzlD domain-containing protein n=1 Tax=Motiliproteus coralliicola TaxID=2283196 RepID=A0A369WCS8_9GAMM|nr:AzlD domain-containing protein [Motiliproteus coralliicola]RDE19838.1 AzlD domain-containing protein [Motiliproteus coralliicola]
MHDSLWLAVVAIAVGTFSMRFLPMLWMQRHLDKHDGQDAIDVMPQWLSLLGPMMIAAMFGGSLVPNSVNLTGWAATACGVLVTLLVWRRTLSLGLPVLAGVFAYGAVFIAFR